MADPLQDSTDRYLRLRRDLSPGEWNAHTVDAAKQVCLPEVSPKAVRGLKFNTALPEHLAVATLASRLADMVGAEQVLAESVQFVIQ